MELNKKEEWKAVPGYEGYYEVSNIGRVRSVTRKIIDRTGRSHTYYGKLLSATSDGSQWGYKHITLMRGGKYKTIRVHRLVATAFIPNPMNYPVINHKDCNPANNIVDNLEWCTPEYNNNYAPTKQKRSAGVIQYNRYGDEVARYKSITDAGRAVGRYHSSICYSLKHGGLCAGYKWERI